MGSHARSIGSPAVNESDMNIIGIYTQRNQLQIHRDIAVYKLISDISIHINTKKPAVKWPNIQIEAHLLGLPKVGRSKSNTQGTALFLCSLRPWIETMVIDYLRCYVFSVGLNAVHFWGYHFFILFP